MPRDLPHPTTCLITTGATTELTEADSAEFGAVLALVARAADAGVALVQLREKSLRPRVLYELAARASRLARGTATRLLVNDRADIARAAGCDGVHLTTRSLDARAVRRAFGHDLLVGVSTHSLTEARDAHESGADYALFGPVFDTPSKRAYGPPLGLAALRDAAREVAPFPLVALGGVTLSNARECLAAGARGVAAIRLFAGARDLAAVVRAVQNEAAHDDTN
jgi:thiamine-phosphate pyrophosphorylase